MNKPSRGATLNRSLSLSRGIIAAWLFNEGTGGKVYDLSSNGNTGTFTNMEPLTDWIPEKNGYALDFDGVDEFVDVTNYFPDPRNFTLCHLVKYDLVGGTIAHTIGAHDAINRFYIGIDGDNNFGIGVGANFIGFGTDNTPSGLSAGVWYCYIVTGDGATASIYIDGVLKKTFSYTSNAASTLDFNIGRRNHATPASRGEVDGKISNVFIYNRALTAGEVKQLHIDPYVPFRTRKKPRIFGEIIAAAADRFRHTFYERKYPRFVEQGIMRGAM